MKISNKSVWSASIEMPEFPQLKKDITTDVLIIGGGMSGILTAYFLQKSGVDYILVEQDRICSGVTKNTTAKITLQHGLNYHKILKDGGYEIAKGYYEANKMALDTFYSICGSLDCDFETRDNYVYSTNDQAKLEAEMAALEKIGCFSRFCKDIPVPVKTVGAVCVPEQAQFNPLKFIAAISKDLNIFENTKVWEMIGNTAVTQKGKIFAKRVVVTTHFPFINKHGSYFLKLYQHRSYVMDLKGPSDVYGMYVDESKTGFSFRNYGDLLLLGGGSHRTGKKGGGFSELENFYTLHYPQAQVEYRWATQDCMSLDDMAYIGNYSKNLKNTFVATGFNKWGMTGSMVAARLLSDMLKGIENQFSHIFSPSRSILKPQLLVNGFETTVNMLNPTTKRCGHLGCALKWNPQEHSWDCACHGSRFDKDGKLLDGPATRDLKE